MPSWLQWLLWSPSGQAVRLSAGVLVLAALAIWDVRRKGAAARRWREYLFLLTVTAVAVLYGLLNDQLTVGISWEYFFYGKGLYEALGQQAPPDMTALRWQAVLVGIRATWWVGLAGGVLVLLANNPIGKLPRLADRRLYALLAWPIGLAVLLAAAGGAAGYTGLFDHGWGFDELVQDDMWRPRRFMAVWGIHLGGYVGSALGLVGAILAVLVQRIRLGRGTRQPACGVPVG